MCNKNMKRPWQKPVSIGYSDDEDESHVPINTENTAAPTGDSPNEQSMDPENDFSEYLWMENEEEFDKEVMQQLEEEELDEQMMQQLEEEEFNEHLMQQFEAEEFNAQAIMQQFEEEEFGESMMQQLEEDELMEQYMEAMQDNLADQQTDMTSPQNSDTANDANEMNVDVANSTLNPFAVEFVPNAGTYPPPPNMK